MRVKKILSMLLVGTLVFGMAVNVNANSIDETKQKANELESKKSEAEAQKADLNDQLNKVVAEMEQTVADIEKKQNEILQKEEELMHAKVTENNQYESMKKRIKYMYENGNTQFIEILFESKTIGDFLNNAEYISQISEYDRNMLVEFQKIVSSIEEQEAALHEENAKLETLRGELVAKQEDVKTMLAGKEEEINSLDSEISANAAKLAELEAAAAEEARRQEEAARAAQAAAAAQSSSGSGSSTRPNISGGAGGSYTGSSSGVLGNPCPSAYISSHFGGRNSPTAGASSNHKGTDFAAGAGAPIYASESGTVVTASYSSVRGNYVVINHGNGMSTLYQHCSALYVSAGQSVSKGQNIAAVGSTGVSTGPHLHFEVHINGTPVDPENYL